MKTNQAFINEYKYIDMMNEVVYNCQKEAAMALYEFNNARRNAELTSFFESSDMEIIMEKENEGFFAKIGNAITKLINQIAEFLTNITNTILGNTKLIKSDEEKVSIILKEHPDLKNTVCKGLKEEWFTYKDIAAYEKDIAGLINMLEQNKIDHKEFSDKIADAEKKFNASAKPIINMAASISTLLLIIPKVTKSCAEAKKSVSTISEMAEKFKKNVDTNYGVHDQDKVTSILNAIAQAAGITTKECSDRTKGQSFIYKTLNKITNGKYGDSVEKKKNNARINAIFNDAQRENDELDAEKEKIRKEADMEVYKNKVRKEKGLKTK
jgi:predicted DNA-binding ArsR family transcriptional regulator